MENEVSMVELVDDTKPKYRGILGTLKGIFADMNHPTRNGRLYSRECWKNAINSDDVKEKLETRTMFGELDHPDDRLETLQERAAIIVTDLQMNEKDGVVEGTAEILDTPFGRILKTFIDAGVKVGISSRGSGEEVVSNKTEGNEIVPETFYLETFDIVALPAVKKARLSLAEAKGSNVITEAFLKEIEQAKSKEQIKELQDYAKDNGIIIDNNVISTPEDNNIIPEKEEEENIDVSSEVISQLEEDLNVSNTKCKELESLCNMMKSHSINVVKELKETKLINEELIKDRENFISQKDELITQLESYKTSTGFLKHKLQESTNRSNSLKEDVSKKDEETNQLKEELIHYKNLLRSLKVEKRTLEKKLLDSENSYNESNEIISKLEKDFNLVKEQKANLLANSSKLEKEIISLKSTNSKLEESIELKDKEISSLNNNVSGLNSQLTKAKLENKKLIKEQKDLKESYIKSRSNDNELDATEIKSLLKENYNISDIDNQINEAIEIKNSMNKLPFNLNSLISEGLTISKEDKVPENTTLNKMAKVVKSSRN